MKDRFSTDSQGYANFRPGYPNAPIECMLAPHSLQVTFPMILRLETI